MKEEAGWFQAPRITAPAFSPRRASTLRSILNELGVLAFNEAHGNDTLEPPFPATGDGLMVTVRPVTDTFAVAGQVRPQEVAALAGSYDLLINNRPDGEEPGQPTHAELESAACAAGVAYSFVPVAGAPGPAQVAAMRRALGGAGGPVLAFCRTGTRSIVTWAAAEALEGRPVATLTAEGARAGYDLGPPLGALLPLLRG